VKQNSPPEISSPPFLEQKSGNSQEDDITSRDLRKLLGNVPKSEPTSVFIPDSKERSKATRCINLGIFYFISDCKKEGGECFQSATKNTKAYQMYLF